MTESDLFHPRNNIVHFKNAIIKHADPSFPIIPRDAEFFIQLKIEDDVVIQSGPLPQFKGLDHWKVDTVDIMLPISPDLFVFTVCRQEAAKYVEMGSVYLAPEDTRAYDGQDFAYELISDYPSTCFGILRSLW